MNRQAWADRLYSKTVTNLETGCWEWVAGKPPANGYPIFSGPIEMAPAGRSRFAGAHRWSYIFTHGEIPAGMELDHLCNVRHCINPAHLEPVTHAENLRRARERGSRPGRRPGTRNRPKPVERFGPDTWSAEDVEKVAAIVGITVDDLTARIARVAA